MDLLLDICQRCLMILPTHSRGETATFQLPLAGTAHRPPPARIYAPVSSLPLRTVHVPPALRQSSFMMRE
jgi:hypothetical protein